MRCVFENIFSKSYLLGYFRKFNLSKITRYTVVNLSKISKLYNNVITKPDEFNVACFTVFFINRFSDTAEGPPPPTGVFAPNDDLQKARRLFEGELVGAEAFVADKDGKYY